MNAPKHASHFTTTALVLGVWFMGSVCGQCFFNSTEHSRELGCADFIARNSPSRFSTKYQDDERDMLYYGYRYYNGSTGRWLSRDPLADKAFFDALTDQLTHRSRQALALQAFNSPYAFVRNSPTTTVDALGLSPADVANIVNKATSGFYELCDKCMRCDNGNLNQLLWFNPFGKIKGCGQQADYVGSQLFGRYDADWSFEIANNFGPFGIPLSWNLMPHQWAQATSNDPADPAIIIDPWKGTIIVAFPPVPYGNVIIFQMTCHPREVKRTFVKQEPPVLPPPRPRGTPPDL